jgi:hypothetical protein
MEGGSGRRDGGRRPTAGYGPSEPRDKLLELRHRRLTFAFRPLFDDVWGRIAALRELDVIDTSLPIGHARTFAVDRDVRRARHIYNARDEAASERKSHRRDAQRRYGGRAATRSLRAESSRR